MVGFLGNKWSSNCPDQCLLCTRWLSITEYFPLCYPVLLSGDFSLEKVMGLLSTGLQHLFQYMWVHTSCNASQTGSTEGWKKSGRKLKGNLPGLLISLTAPKRVVSEWRRGRTPHCPAISHSSLTGFCCFIWHLRGNPAPMLCQLLCISQVGCLAEATRTPEGIFLPWWLNLIHKCFH